METIKGKIGVTRITEVDVYVHDNYYVQHGGILVNIANDSRDIVEGVHLDTIYDIDAFTWDKPILSEDDFMKAITLEDDF